MARLAACLMCAGLSLATLPASAQTLAIPNTGVERPNRVDTFELKLNEINHEDCILPATTGDIIEFTLTVSNPGSYHIEAWASSSSDCTTEESRTEGTCWQVANVADVDAPSTTVPIAVRDIIARNLASSGTYGPGTGTIEDCSTQSGSGQTDVSINFLLLSSTGAIPEGFTPAVYEMTFDLAGPEPPSDVNAGVAEGALAVDFTASDDNDLHGYYIYCDVAGAAPPASGGTSGAGGDTTAGAGGSGGTTTAGAGGSGGTTTAGAGGSGGTTTAGAGGSGGTTTSSGRCSSANLVPNEIPTIAPCGKLTKTAESGLTDSKLTNGEEYAVGVAAYDIFGNPGPLSPLTCATPEDLIGFYDAYQTAGGQGGGGYCSISAPARSALTSLFLVGGLLLTGALRRRSRRSVRST